MGGILGLRRETVVRDGRLASCSGRGCMCWERTSLALDRRAGDHLPVSAHGGGEPTPLFVPRKHNLVLASRPGHLNPNVPQHVRLGFIHYLLPCSIPTIP
jgi:hypothetical protein